MRPTSWRVLVAAVVLAGVAGWLLFRAAYGDLVKLPNYAAVTAGLMAVFELALARVIGQKVRGRVRGRQVHPLQVARAAALAKASSLAGALLFGLYAGFFVWLIPDAGRARVKADDAVTAALSAAVCLLLMVAALLLERACRTPEPSED